ncbi:hypothetical protein Hdeb2414_s0002g00066481 [Helianthus debilis subsp. tardiflorus]
MTRNLGNMLLIIIPTVCKEKGTPFGDSDVCSEYGTGTGHTREYQLYTLVY